jgi:hypothetical protein
MTGHAFLVTVVKRVRLLCCRGKGGDVLPSEDDPEGSGAAESGAGTLFWVGPVATLARVSFPRVLDTLPQALQDASVMPVSLDGLRGRLAWLSARDAVLSPLFWPGGDAMETALMLDGAPSPPAYRVILPDLPRPDLVAREILAAAPRVDLAVIREG